METGKTESLYRLVLQQEAFERRELVLKGSLLSQAEYNVVGVYGRAEFLDEGFLLNLVLFLRIVKNTNEVLLLNIHHL